MAAKWKKKWVKNTIKKNSCILLGKAWHLAFLATEFLRNIYFFFLFFFYLSCIYIFYIFRICWVNHPYSHAVSICNYIFTFIPLWEWTWCHRVIYVGQDWIAWIVSLQENKLATTKKVWLKPWCTCKDSSWCYIHSQNGMKFRFVWRKQR